jgi:hypothetical protein
MVPLFVLMCSGDIPGVRPVFSADGCVVGGKHAGRKMDQTPTLPFSCRCVEGSAGGTDCLPIVAPRL